MFKKFSILVLLATFLGIGTASTFAQDRDYHRHDRTVVVRTERDHGRRHHRFWRRHHYRRY
ncbi:MAG TPA: hypothetical protein VFC63_03605 [Blastocatellia bacterium]|nr:hypothetical protein [Blastocatellia bacterium]